MLLTIKETKTSSSPVEKIRLCTCPEDKDICPIETIKIIIERKWLPFNLTNEELNGDLRKLLELSGHEDACNYRFHDIRRGVPEDLEISGASEQVKRTAGNWLSGAHKKYHSERGFSKILKDASKTF